MNKDDLKRKLEQLKKETENMNEEDREAYYRIHLMEEFSTGTLEDSKTVSEYISCCMKHHPDFGKDKCVAIAMDKKRKGELVDDSDQILDEEIKNLIDTFKKGKYDRCMKLGKRLGLSKEESHIFCSKFLSLDAEKTVEEEYPEFSELTEEEIKKKKKKEMEKTAKKTTPAGQKGASPKVKVLREVIKSKPKYMQLPLYQPMRAMKSQHRLQTKMEIPRTLEQKFLTMEQLAKRAQYAVSIKKRDSFIAGFDSLEFDSYEILDNIIKIPITLTKEIVQPYPKKDENGGILRDENGNPLIEYHFKPYEELVKGIINLEELPIIIEHKKWNELDVVGYVRELEADSEKRRIKGWGYLIKDKLPKFLLDRILQNMIIPVSIGFWANVIREAGNFNGTPYDAVQKDFALDHLAICISSIPRCPPDQCGMNIDAEEINENLQKLTENYDFKLIMEDAEYIDIINNLEKKDISNISNKNGEKILDNTKPIIARSYSGEGKDLTKLLSKLREYLGILPPDKKADADNIILSIMELMVGDDKKMEDSKFQEEIAKLKTEITQLKDSLKSKDEIIKEKQKMVDAFEEEKRKELIEKIKKFSVYEDSELQDECLAKLKIIADAVTRFEPSNKKPKPPAKEGHMQGRDTSGQPRLGPLSSKEAFKSYKEDE